MNTYQSTNQILVRNMAVHAEPGKPKFINSDYLMEISSGNAEFIQVFLTQFKEEVERSLQNLQRQLLCNDFYFMEKTAHAMKPSGVYVGSYPFTVLVSLLEKAAHEMDRIEVKRLIPQLQSLTENILNEMEEYFQ